MNKNLVGNQIVQMHARSLKMPGVVAALDGLVRQAEKERWSFQEFLQEVLAAEVTSRHNSAVRNRIHAARFPDVKTLDSFEFDSAGGLDARQVQTLGKCQFIDAAENVVLLGPVGTGKTHLAIALGVEACRQRRHVLFFRAADLVRTLLEARDERLLGVLQRRIARVPLLIIDELGFVPFDRHGGELLFNVLSGRHQKRSVIVTSNLAFSEWPAVFGGDEKLTAALLDRLAETATVLTTQGKSYRMAKRAKLKDNPVAKE